MLRERGGAPGITMVWSGAAPPPRPATGDGIAQRLDLVQARLDALEASPAERDPQTLPAAPPAAHHAAQQEQEMREIRRLVADLTAEVLGADHPLVAPLRDAPLRAEHLRPQRPSGVVAPVMDIPAAGFLGAGLPAASRTDGRGPLPVDRVLSFLARWSPARAARRRPAL